MPFGFINDKGKLRIKAESTVNSNNVYTFYTSALNIISWYNPENVSSSNGVVTGWNDSLGTNNFTTVSGTINVVTYNGYKILYSPPLNYPNIGPYLDGPNATGKSLGGILFGYQDISLNQEGFYSSYLFFGTILR
jgi:hypothetical protein